MRIAVIGRHGQIARSLIERGRATGVDVLPLARPQIDLAGPDPITAALAALTPDVVVNAAAFTAVDRAEAEPDLAFAINASGANAAAVAAAEIGVPLVHLSTDYVFDGGLYRPYRESDPPNPINVYGHSKFEGEIAVAAAQPDHAILRTAWVYSPFGTNFVRTMLRIADERDDIAVVADQRGAPSSALDIADGILAVARQLVARPQARELRGTFHMTCDGEATWAEFAAAIFAASLMEEGPSTRVTPIPSSAYPTPARRPANSRLDCSKLWAAYGIRLPHWRHSLPECVSRILGPAS